MDNLDPSKSKFISYDDLNRLVQVDEGLPPLAGGTPLPVEDYAYDEEGNRTASHLSAFYASNAHNQLLEDDGFTYAYDAKGNRVSKTSKADGSVETYTYDSQNRLVGYASTTTTASYAYDALERRIAKSVGSTQSSYVYDISMEVPLAYDDLLLRFDGGISQILKRRWLHTNIVDEALSYENYSQTSTAGTGTVHEVFADKLGSVISAVEIDTGQQVSATQYDSFGISQRSGNEGLEFGFTGRHFDPETSSTFMRARTLVNKTGNFLQSDPIGFEGGQENLYAYVGNNAFNYIDPRGLAAKKPGSGARHPEMTIMSFAKAELREQAITNVAEGLFSLVGQTVGELAHMGKYLEELDKASGGKTHDHHCNPKYLGGDERKANMRKISTGKHRFLHKMMRLYLRSYDLDYAPGYNGRFIRKRFGDKAASKIADNFYKDMKSQFNIDFGC